MTVQINYKNSGLKNKKSNLILFVGENFNITGIKKLISDTEFLYISDLLKISDTKKNLLVFEISPKKSIEIQKPKIEPQRQKSIIRKRDPVSEKEAELIQKAEDYDTNMLRRSGK